MIFFAGDNHFGYLGYRGLIIPISDNGAIESSNRLERTAIGVLTPHPISLSMTLL
jgi:hypothetical protein